MNEFFCRRDVKARNAGGSRLPVSAETGVALRDVSLDQLGRGRRVEVDRGKMVIIGGYGETGAIAVRVVELENQAAAAAPEQERDGWRERVAKLGAGVAPIKVGGGSELE